MTRPSSLSRSLLALWLLVGCGPPSAPTPEVARLQRANRELERDLAELRALQADTQRQLRDAQLLIHTAEAQADAHTDFSVHVPGPPVPAIDGHVVDADLATPQAWVTLDVGADDELEVGYALSVYRANQFVGKVVVVAPLRRDTSRACVLFVADGQRFRPGDAAATRLQ